MKIELIFTFIVLYIVYSCPYFLPITLLFFTDVNKLFSIFILLAGYCSVISFRVSDVYIFPILAIICFITKCYKYITLKNIVLTMLRTSLYIFFRKMTAEGQNHIPEKGPVLFVCGPHINQFCDAVIVAHFTPRNLRFLAAAKTMTRKYVGFLGRAMESIPVVRPQDMAVLQTGFVTPKNERLIGNGTKFQETLQVGSRLLLSQEEISVEEIISDTEIIIRPILTKSCDYELPYKLIPRIDNSEAFVEVKKVLLNSECVAIFPEGGSHDRTDFLPFKAGAAVMALSALQANPDLPLNIVPVGLNYFSGHRFRSKIHVEFGDPFQVPSELKKRFNEGDRHSSLDLLTLIESELRKITINAPNEENLHFIYAIRRLYKPSSVKLDPVQTLELTKTFERGWQSLQDEPLVQELKKRVEHYMRLLEIHDLRDHQVKVTSLGGFRTLGRLIFRVFMLINFTSFSLPGLVLNLPLILMTRFVSNKKAQEAVEASAVKIAGSDVIASWKIMIGLWLFPLVFFLYPLLAGIIGWYLEWGALRTWFWFAMLQPFAMWSSVRFTEAVIEILQSLPPLILTTFDKRSAFELRVLRKQLQTDIRELVHSYWNVFFPDSDGAYVPGPEGVSRKYSEVEFDEEDKYAPTFSLLRPC